MKTIFTTAACLFFLLNISFAQGTRFVTSGIIEYDKTANMFAILTGMFNKVNQNEQVYYQRSVEQYKKTMPQFRTLKSTLSFGDNKMLFTPIAPAETPMNGIFMPTADQNSIVYRDFTANSIISQKTVFEETFLVKDTLKKIKWKITDETQEIAGYTCRRANALILDSVYVVAFYADRIPVTGGPEAFWGLPGIILKLAIPHENLIWTATKVTDTTLPPTALVPPKKGKLVNNKQLVIELKSALKNAGPYSQIFQKALAL